MFCRHCGEKIDDDSKFCIHCGKPSQIVAEDSYEDDAIKTSSEKKPYDRWSWGAFGLGWIYFCGMKYKYWGWLFILGIITNGLLKDENAGVASIGGVVWLIAIIVFGIKGRRIAWKSKEWKSEKEFISAQRVWDIWGIIIFIVLNVIWFFIPTS